MADNITTSCINGELQPGDLVLSSPNDDYACLVGTVLSINKVGTSEHDRESENDTDDIHVDFTVFDYSDSRIAEIESMFSELYGMPKPFEECPLDDTIMAPDALIRITGIGRHLRDAILDSEQAAEAVFLLVKDGPGFDRSSISKPDHSLMDYAEFEQIINTHFYKISPEALDSYRKLAEGLERDGVAGADETYRDLHLQFGLAALETEIYHVGRLINLGPEFTVEPSEVRSAARHVADKMSDADLKDLAAGKSLDGTEKDYQEYRAALAAYENDGGISIEKLYSPLNFHLVDNDYLEEYDGEYWRDELPDREALEFKGKIEDFVNADREYYSSDRGLAEHLDDGPIKDKIFSLVPAIEEVDGSLWMVADIKQTEPLSPLELATLKDYWAGQLSDGVGESWEQREIKTYRGDLYMEPWTSGKSFFIDTKEEFDRRMKREVPIMDAPVSIVPVAETSPIPTPSQTIDERLAQIAEKHCRVETLKTRMSDSLDFHDVSVWGLKAALQEAFDAGASWGLTRESEKDLDAPPASVDKPSVLDKLRHAAKEPKPPAKRKQDKSEPEI